MAKKKNKGKRGGGSGGGGGGGANNNSRKASDDATPAAVEAPAQAVKEATPSTTTTAATTRPAGLESNWAILSKDEQKLADLLLAAGQAHLFDGWEAAGTNDAAKHAFFAQVKRLHETYPFPGGLSAYVERAKELLAASASGINPLDGWTPEVPDGEVLEPGSARYCELEAAGQSELGKTAFVLVAGGLGERLGYSGIKVALPTELTTETTYLEFYLKYLQAVGAAQSGGGKTTVPPLAIMVSDDTHDRTLALLEAKQYFGYPKAQLTLMKQEKVAALSDNDARIAKEGLYKVDCKPHGHGDVHSLLHSTGLAKKWQGQGVKWVVFFQDTNALAFVSLAAALGVSQNLGLEVNSLAIPRFPKQAIGAITRLKHAKDDKVLVVNVEYNQLDPLLRASVSPEGDVADAASKDGHSPYPGNINQLIFALAPYVATLEKTHGVMGEFVNPKYADAARTVFKKPTRLECMMQDYPKVLAKTAKVGFTSLPAWYSFSPVKNNAADAAKAAQGGTPPGSASSGEADQYYVFAEQLRLLGCQVAKAPVAEYAGIPVSLGPRIVLDPSWALTYSALKAKVPSPDKVSISAASTLVVATGTGGGDVELQSLALDGALVLSVGAGTTVVLKDLAVKNKGHTLVPVPADDPNEVLRMRGYTVAKTEELRVDAPANAGRVVLTAEGKLVPEAEFKGPQSPPPKAPRPPSNRSLGTPAEGTDAAAAPVVVVPAVDADDAATGNCLNCVVS